MVLRIVPNSPSHEIREAIASCDGKALHFAAHELKGAVGNFSAKSTFDAALRLEMMGRDGDMSEAEEAYAVLENEIACLTRALAMFRKEVVA